MIRTDLEYRDALKRLDRDREVMTLQRKALQERGLSASEVELAMQPSISFHMQLGEEVDEYERLLRGDTAVIQSLADIGRILIGLRIARHLSQKDLAERLGVHESSVSRDERNDYHGITVDRAQRIISALDGSVTLQARAPEVELEPA